MALRFEGFELDQETLELSRDGELLPLPPQPARVLALLAANPGRTLSREEIQRHVWGDDHVEADLGLNSCIRKIRAQLGDDVTDPRFIRTLPRRGYRFVARVESDMAPPPRTAPFPRAGWIWAAAFLVAAVLWLWLDPGSEPERSPATADPLALAVLPFENLTGDAAQDFIADGLTEETIARLGKIEPDRLAVIARTTAMQLETDDRNLTTLARELRVGYLLEGSVRRHNGRLRATVRLIDGATGLQTGSEAYEVSADDLLMAQVTVADRVAGWLVEELLPGETLLADSSQLLDDDLYEVYLQGLHRLQEGSAEGYVAARDRFAEIVEGAPDFAPAWSGLAEAELWLHWFGDRPGESLEAARAAAERAIHLAPDLANPQLLLAYASLYVDFDLDEAGERFAHAATLEPGSARAQAWYAAYLSAIGVHDQAIERAELARRLDPLAMAARADLCWLYNYARRFDDALRACGSALELQPGDAWTSLGKLEALRQLNRHAEAVETLAGVVASLGGEAPLDWDELAEQAPEAALEQALEWLVTSTSRRPQPYFAASIAAMRGQESEALEHLDAAWQARNMLLVFVGVDPRFDRIRSSPGFQELVDRLGLPS